jgi:hypothetical protein
MARGDLEVDLEQSASWHIKVVRKGSNNGKIYVGVETVEAKGSSPMLIGTDWFRNEYVDCAYYYCSDGDICRGNQVIMSTGTGFGNGDVVGIQIVDRNLTFLRNGNPVGKPLSGLKRWVTAAVQMHRPGDKVLLLRELAGAAAGKDIARTKVLMQEQKQAQEEEIRRKEQARLEQQRKAEEKIRMEKEAQRQAEEEAKRQAELEEQRKREEEEQQRQRAAEAEARKQRQEEEKKRLAELRRAKQLREETARKKAAEEQIKKVARSRGGSYVETPDPDAPDETEIQDFLRSCLPLRLTAARQMGMSALPVIDDFAWNFSIATVRIVSVICLDIHEPM